MNEDADEVAIEILIILSMINLKLTAHIPVSLDIQQVNLISFSFCYSYSFTFSEIIVLNYEVG